ncbi:hypothetical protein ACQKWADRAFT_260099 [Trichoderma austrokoningii]
MRLLPIYMWNFFFFFFFFCKPLGYPEYPGRRDELILIRNYCEIKPFYSVRCKYICGVRATMTQLWLIQCKASSWSSIR